MNQISESILEKDALLHVCEEAMKKVKKLSKQLHKELGKDNPYSQFVELAYLFEKSVHESIEKNFANDIALIPHKINLAQISIAAIMSILYPKLGYSLGDILMEKLCEEILKTKLDTPDIINGRGEELIRELRGKDSEA